MSQVLVSRIWEGGEVSSSTRPESKEEGGGAGLGRASALHDALGPKRIKAFVFRRWSRRMFFAVPQDDAAEMLGSRTARFAEKWSEHLDLL